MPLAESAVTVGRVRINDLSFPEDGTLSRQHFTLRKRDDATWAVRDLGTRNGTRVNGETIAEERELRDGDIISAGQVILRFESGGVPLNNQSGGLNIYAVEHGIALGAKLVWMPTFSSKNHIEQHKKGQTTNFPNSSRPMMVSQTAGT